MISEALVPTPDRAAIDTYPIPSTSRSPHYESLSIEAVKDGDLCMAIFVPDEFGIYIRLKLGAVRLKCMSHRRLPLVENATRLRSHRSDAMTHAVRMLVYANVD